MKENSKKLLTKTIKKYIINIVQDKNNIYAGVV